MVQYLMCHAMCSYKNFFPLTRCSDSNVSDVIKSYYVHELNANGSRLSTVSIA